jgi:hypothetical protein
VMNSSLGQLVLLSWSDIITLYFFLEKQTSVIDKLIMLMLQYNFLMCSFKIHIYIIFFWISCLFMFS